jgi:ribonucleoside-diphosphate reductase alpha chain
MFKKLRASELWKKHLTMLFETGHPWITWKDPSNVRSPQDHIGVVHSSNLCTEITLNTSDTETAVCNLGSINLGAFVTSGRFDRDLVARVVPVAMRMLDNVIDVNFYPTEKTKRSNMRHRPVGLGLRGLQDALYKLGLNFDSDEAVRFSDESQEAISYHAILSSSLLAKERGTYETYKGSKWSRGILPQDTLALLEQERGTKIDVPRHETLDWRLVREAVRQWGMRNSNTMAHAPTATTANIAGCYPTIEPIYKNLYVKSNMAGDFMVVNDFLVEDLKKLGLWSADMLEKIKYYDGSVQEIAEIPPAIREKYKEVFEIEPQWLIKAAAWRGRWIDQSQSLNIFYGGTSGKVLSEIYQYAWDMGLKTTYYLRTMGASRIEKSTVNMQKFGGTSKTETSVASNQGSTPSSVILEETVTIASSGMGSVPSPVMLDEAVYTAASSARSALAELKKAQEAVPEENSPQSMTTHTLPSSAEAAASKTLYQHQPQVQASRGVPTFGGGTTAVKNRPKIEVIGETCENCSA